MPEVRTWEILRDYKALLDIIESEELSVWNIDILNTNLT